MSTCIAFFRDLNVGGRDKLPMNELVEAFDKAGVRDARTCLQSGNVAFRCTKQQRPEIARRVGGVIKASRGFQPSLVVIRIQELEHAIAANPYPEARKDPESLHLWFLAQEPGEPDLDRLNALKAATERFTLHRKIFYLHTPGGIDESALSAAVEECLGVEGALRSWKTVTRTLELGWEF